MARFKETPSHDRATVPRRRSSEAAHSARAAPARRATASARGSRTRTTGGAAQVRGVRSYKDKTQAKYKRSEAPKGVLLGIAIAALIVIVFAVIFACSAINTTPEVTPDNAAETTEAKTSAAPGESLEYNGYTYGLSQDANGAWILTSSGGTGEATTLYTFEGAPIGVVAAGGKVYAPENLSDGTWDIVCYMTADGGEPFKMLNADESVRTGNDLLTSVEIQGTSLVLISESATVAEIALS